MEDIVDNSEISELTEFVNTGKSVAFIGSGLSMGEYIGWSELVMKLCNVCGVEIASGDKNLLDLAQRAKSASFDKYYRVLSEEFGKEVVNIPTRYNYLLESPFNAYITINFDPLLAEASRFKKFNIYDFTRGLDSSRVREKAIFYIHGYVETGVPIKDGDLILSKGDFESHYGQDGGIIHSFLTQVLSIKPVVFIGCGLQEPALKNILELCAKIKSRIELRSQKSGPTHYILLPTLYTKTPEDEKPVRDIKKEAKEKAQYEEFGVRIIRYVRNSPNDYSPVEKILKNWSKAPEIKPVSIYDEGPNYD